MGRWGGAMGRWGTFLNLQAPVPWRWLWASKHHSHPTKPEEDTLGASSTA